jgi:hypothetical protein
MSRHSLLALAAVLALLAAPTASAATLASASLGFVIGTLPAASFSGSGTTGQATTDLLATLGAGTSFAGSFTSPVTDPSAVPITAIQVLLTKNGAGSFSGTTPGNVGGSASFTGVANVKGFGGMTLLGVPLNLGSGATSSASAYGINITAISGIWTAGTAVVTGLTGTATAATLAGSNGLNASGVGTLVLVTPVKLMTNLVGVLPGFGILTLTYVAPEPGLLLLVGAAVAGLVAAGRRRS